MIDVDFWRWNMSMGNTVLMVNIPGPSCGGTQRITDISFTYDSIPGKYADIVNDVVNDAAIHWAAGLLCGLNVITKDSPIGISNLPSWGLMTTNMVGRYARRFSKLVESLKLWWLQSIMNSAPPSGEGTATDFPTPTKVDSTRPASSYNYHGVGFHKCLGIAEIIRIVFSLKNVRRAPGNDGKLIGFTEIQNQTPTNV
ncbi:hypothetical protein L218DRAFT_947320 [Marasmius fiardii PR-910]|nr:hypothetical protein L218DRAFT_947320 [Marasmius fiardii PR-910]